MNKTPLALISIIALSGCASAHMPTGVQRELKAWESAYTEAEKACPAFSKDIPERSEALSHSRCVTRIVNKTVLPVALYPDLVTRNRNSALNNAADYAQGKISAERYKQIADKNWDLYIQRIDQNINSDLERASSTRQKNSQAVSNALEQAISVYNTTSSSTPIQVNTPKTTTCNTVGNTLSCTTW